MNKQQTTYTGISFGSALGLLFIGLKLGGIIDWSWWLVLSPFYFGILIVCQFFLTVYTNIYETILYSILSICKSF